MSQVQLYVAACAWAISEGHIEERNEFQARSEELVEAYKEAHNLGDEEKTLVSQDYLLLVEMGDGTNRTYQLTNVQVPKRGKNSGRVRKEALAMLLSTLEPEQVMDIKSLKYVALSSFSECEL